MHQSDLILIITFVILCFILLMKSEIMGNDLHYVISNFDNKKYLVRQLPDDSSAADLLSQIRTNLKKLTQYLIETYPDDPRVKQISARFNANNIMETDGNSSYTSYSVNKGEKIVLCLRKRDGSNALIDINTIMFVTLHEYSHILTKSVGHTEEFWNNFRFVLSNAVKLGIYDCVDYQSKPQKYCGIEINSSPYSCKL
jgi:hypothetical protein